MRADWEEGAIEFPACMDKEQDGTWERRAPVSS